MNCLADWSRRLPIASASRETYRQRVLLAFNKPYGVLSQFTPDHSPNRTLADFGFPKHVYPLGRLDADSEGLLLLTDEPRWNAMLLRPENSHARRYWAQVEGEPTRTALDLLQRGVVIQGRKTRPCRARVLNPQPIVPPRNPPVRRRLTIPTTWIELELIEGRNRQARKMTAAIRHPTLRLIRVAIGRLDLGDLVPGRWRETQPRERDLLLR